MIPLRVIAFFLFISVTRMHSFSNLCHNDPSVLK